MVNAYNLAAIPKAVVKHIKTSSSIRFLECHCITHFEKNFLMPEKYYPLPYFSLSTFSHHLGILSWLGAAYGITWPLAVLVGDFWLSNRTTNRKSSHICISYSGIIVRRVFWLITTNNLLLYYSFLHWRFYLFDDPWTICLIFSQVMWDATLWRLK